MLPSVEPYIHRWQITPRIRCIAKTLRDRYGDDLPLFVVIMDGGAKFAEELLQSFPGADVERVKIQSYEGVESTKTPVVPMVPGVMGRDVVIIDDIIDSGRTYEAVKEKMLSWGANDVSAVCLLLRERPKPFREVSSCFLVYGGNFFVGFGMDYNGLYRDLGSIHTLTEAKS